MMKHKTLLCLLVSLWCQLAFAWENHAQMTALVLADWAKQDAHAAQYLQEPIKAESLASFLQATQGSLPEKLRDIEQWLVKHEPGYRRLPVALIYDPEQAACHGNLETCFKKAIRVNLDVATPCVVYNQQDTLAIVAEGSQVMRADVIAAATLQPDLGLDLFLYEDSPSDFGKLYGFGTQPLGLETPIGSQVMFHMSAYGENKLVLFMKPRLKENYPEARAYLYAQLSRYAKENGHPYWSAIFMGWSLHYIQDMTQPYHTSLSLGIKPTRAFYKLLQSALGYHKPLDSLKLIQENRHVLLEKLTAWLLSSGQSVSALHHYALDKTLPPCDLSQAFIRDIMQPRMQAIATAFPVLLKASLPSQYVSNADFNVDKFDHYADLYLREMSDQQRRQFNQALQPVLGLFGAYTRQCIRQAM